MFLFLIYLALIAVALIIFLARRKLLPYSFKYLGVMLGITLSLEITDYLLKLRHINPRSLHHIYQPIEFLLLASVYYSTFAIPIHKKIVRFSIVPFLVMACIGSFFIDDLGNLSSAKFPRVSFLLESSLLVVFAVLYIYELYQRPVYANILNIPFFWINTGLLFYCAGTFFQMGFHYYVQSINPILARDLNLVNQVLNYFLYSCFIKAFLCKTSESLSLS